MQFLRGVPSVHNDPALTRELIGYMEELTGRPVTILDKPISGSDDMSVISQAVPTAYFVVGTGTEDEGVRYPVHNARVVFDESVFAEGAAMTATMALRWLAAPRRRERRDRWLRRLQARLRRSVRRSGARPTRSSSSWSASSQWPSPR